MSRNIAVIVLFTALAVLLSGCKPSYPKESVTESIEKLLKNESKLDGHAKLVGETVYLQVDLVGLVSTEQEALSAILKKVQTASLIVTRVALSSDANIKNLVLVVNEPTYKLNIRIIQRVEDVKGYLYMKISRSDYEERLILEIENNEGKPEDLNNEIEKEKDLSAGEFVGRLIVSQINMLSRSNPFLGVMLENAQVKYVNFDGIELVASISQTIPEQTMLFFTDLINTQALKINKKYIATGPKRIKLIDGKNNITLIDIIPKKSKTKPRFINKKTPAKFNQFKPSTDNF